jgi:hypothetical protein
LFCVSVVKAGARDFRRIIQDQAKKRKHSKMLGFLFETGAEGQNRTADTGIFSPLLYRLSYLGTMNPAGVNT